MLISCCAVVKRMVTGCGGKLKAPVAKQKLFELERKGEIFFQAERTILLCVVGENRGADPNFGEETALRVMSLEITLFSLDFVHRKQWQTSQHPPPPTPKKEKQ